MRNPALALVILLAGVTQAQATAGFSCNADDKSAALSITGAYGTSLGSSLANFGGDLQLRHPKAPDDVHTIKLERSHVSQSWFRYRDLRLMATWLAAEGKPFREILVIVETRRGRAEEAPYRGRYTIVVASAAAQPGGEAQRLELTGVVTCLVD